MAYNSSRCRTNCSSKLAIQITSCEHLYQKVARGAPLYVACLCDVGADDIRTAQSHRRRNSGLQSLTIGMLISSAIHPAKNPLVFWLNTGEHNSHTQLYSP